MKPRRLRKKKGEPCESWCGVVRLLPTSQTMGRMWCTKACRDKAERAEEKAAKKGKKREVLPRVLMVNGARLPDWIVQEPDDVDLRDVVTERERN